MDCMRRVRSESSDPIRLTASAANVLPHQIDGLINDFGGEVESRPKADGVLSRAQSKQAEIEKSFPEFFPRFAIGQIEGHETSPAAHSRNHGRFILQLLQLLEEIRSHPA